MIYHIYCNESRWIRWSEVPLFPAPLGTQIILGLTCPDENALRHVLFYVQQYLDHFQPDAGSTFIGAQMIRWNTLYSRVCIEVYGRCGVLLHRRESETSHRFAAFNEAMRAIAEHLAVEHEDNTPF